MLGSRQRPSSTPHCLVCEYSTYRTVNALQTVAVFSPASHQRVSSKTEAGSLPHPVTQTPNNPTQSGGGQPSRGTALLVP